MKTIQKIVRLKLKQTREKANTLKLNTKEINSTFFKCFFQSAIYWWSVHLSVATAAESKYLKSLYCKVVLHLMCYYYYSKFLIIL